MGNKDDYNCCRCGKKLEFANAYYCVMEFKPMIPLSINDDPIVIKNILCSDCCKKITEDVSKDIFEKNKVRDDLIDSLECSFNRQGNLAVSIENGKGDQKS